MLDTIGLSINGGIYLNLTLISQSQSEAIFIHSPAHFRGVRVTSSCWVRWLSRVAMARMQRRGGLHFPSMPTCISIGKDIDDN